MNEGVILLSYETSKRLQFAIWYHRVVHIIVWPNGYPRVQIQSYDGVV